jgi:hypothetical protein
MTYIKNTHHFRGFELTFADWLKFCSVFETLTRYLLYCWSKNSTYSFDRRLLKWLNVAFAVIVGPVARNWQVKDYIQRHLTGCLLPALTALAHERPAEPVMWLAQQLRRRNPNEPELAPQALEEREDHRCHTPQPSEDSLAK